MLPMLNIRKLDLNLYILKFWKDNAMINYFTHYEHIIGLNEMSQGIWGIEPGLWDMWKH